MDLHSFISYLYREYSDDLFSYAVHLGFDENSAMDAIHDVFYKLCARKIAVEKISNPQFYLFKALKNRLLDMCRTKREYESPFNDEAERIGEMPFNLSVTIEDTLIEEEDMKEIRSVIEKMLNRLTDRQREAIYLRYIKEYDYEKVAELMRISIESCRNLISKSLKKMRDSSSLFLLLILIMKYHIF